MNFRIDTKQLLSGLESYNERAKSALRMYAETSAKNFESYAKRERKWTDRTNRARLGLTGYVKQTDNGYRIYLAHTVDYGLWLEYAREKKYAILEPTIRLEGPKIIAGLKKMLDRMKV